MFTHIHPHKLLRKIKVASCNHQVQPGWQPILLVAWSDLVICNIENSMVIQGTNVLTETRCQWTTQHNSDSDSASTAILPQIWLIVRINDPSYFLRVECYILRSRLQYSLKFFFVRHRWDLKLKSIAASLNSTSVHLNCTGIHENSTTTRCNNTRHFSVS